MAGPCATTVRFNLRHRQAVGASAHYSWLWKDFGKPKGLDADENADARGFTQTLRCDIKAVGHAFDFKSPGRWRTVPLTYAGGERTPLLIIIGLRGTRAPYPAAIAFYKTVLENGGPAKLLADPAAGHFPSDPQGIIAWYSATFGWLARYGAPAIPDAVLPN